MNLYIFRDDFSRSGFRSFKTVDGIERHLVGKFIDIEVLGEGQAYDLWRV